MSKALWLLVLPPLGLALCSCAASSAPPHSGADGSAPAPAGASLAEAGESEESVALDSVPSAVRTAAQGAVSGIVFSSAERETENGATVYSLRGTANGKTYEIEVNAAGQVVEVENGDCDECDGDDDRDDD